MTEPYDLVGSSDDEIEHAVGAADPMTLRGLLYQLTGDEEVAQTKLDTMRVGFYDASYVCDPADVALLRQKAVDLLKGYRDAGTEHFDIGPRDRLQRSLGLAIGSPVGDDELEMWIEECGFDPLPRALRWRAEPGAARLADFQVVVIGAGMGGLNVALHLKEAGISFRVLEKNSSVGGTWYENRYPGARVDTPSRTYTHSYGVRYSKPNPFCAAAENEKYINWIADNFDVRGHIQFDTEVKSLTWDETTSEWEIVMVGPEGRSVVRANAVVSCVGFLSRPNVPELPGAESFRGPIFHTARWQADFDPDGKRVAVIGSGCSGYQLLPVLAKTTAHTYLFQRTPSWMFDVEGYVAPFPPQVTWLESKFPYYAHFARFRTMSTQHPDTILAAFGSDPDFDHPCAVSPISKLIWEERVAFLESKFADHPDLLEKMTPTAPPFSSRPVLVDRSDSVCDALVNGTATLVSEAIDTLTPTGIRTVDGCEHDVDAIVLATGFKANEFLWPMEVTGRDGRTIAEVWEHDGARAYLGTLVPGFPNLFIVYGPNTNPTGGLGLAQMEEAVTKFILECLGHLILEDRAAVEVSGDAYWRYNREVDRAESRKVYVDRRVQNYYKNEFGRSSANQPFDARLVWSWLRSPDGSWTPPENSWARDWTEAPLRPYFGEDLIVS